MEDNQGNTNKNPDLPLLTEDDLLSLTSPDRSISSVRPNESQYWSDGLTDKTPADNKKKFTVQEYMKNKKGEAEKEKTKKKKKHKHKEKSKSKSKGERYPFDWAKIKRPEKETGTPTELPAQAVCRVRCQPGSVPDLSDRQEWPALQEAQPAVWQRLGPPKKKARHHDIGHNSPCQSPLHNLHQTEKIHSPHRGTSIKIGGLLPPPTTSVAGRSGDHQSTTLAGSEVNPFLVQSSAGRGRPTAGQASNVITSPGPAFQSHSFQYVHGSPIGMGRGQTALQALEQRTRGGNPLLPRLPFIPTQLNGLTALLPSHTETVTDNQIQNVSKASSVNPIEQVNQQQ